MICMSHKVGEIRVDKGATQLAGAVGTKIHEDNGVAGRHCHGLAVMGNGFELLLICAFLSSDSSSQKLQN